MADALTRDETRHEPGTKRRNTKRTVIAVIALVALIYLVIFVARNGRTVEVDWVFGSTDGPLVFVILASVLLGLVIGAGGLLVWQGRRRRKRG
jgi:uncharacterized integral membrane protein